MEEKLLESIEQTTVLGLIITSDLTWKKNTEHLISKANSRMIILRKLIQFPVPTKDLVMLYGQFIRSILEFNSTVWFSSITNEESEALESVQKTACKLILKNKYTTYEDALEILKLDELKSRRLKLATKFAKGCQQISAMQDIFKASKPNQYELRKKNPFDVKHATGQRLYKSTVPTLQRILNNIVE